MDMQGIRDLVKKALPPKYLAAYRRRRLLRQYLRALGWELYERQTTLGWSQEEIEEKIAARHDGFYQRMVREVLERTDLVLQGLDRKIEGVGTRHENELRALRDEVAALRAMMDRPPVSPPNGQPAPSLPSAEAVPAAEVAAE